MRCENGKQLSTADHQTSGGVLVPSELEVADPEFLAGFDEP